MSQTIMEGRLLAGLNGDADLIARGCAALPAPTGGVAVERRGHHLGLWRWASGTFQFTPAGYGEPTVQADTVAEALHHTRERVLAR